MRRMMLACVVAITLLGVGIHAHHPFAATYYEDREVTVKGQVVQLLFRDPHSFLQLKVTEPGKPPQTWSVEWLGRTLLTSQGVSIQSLKPGETVLATGSPGRSGAELCLRLKVLTRPHDGWKWYAASGQMGRAER